MLAVWLFFKNSGQCASPLPLNCEDWADLAARRIIAGAINLGTNIHRSKGGKGQLSSRLGAEHRWR